jgi:hypothetical protein
MYVYLSYHPVHREAYPGIVGLCEMAKASAEQLESSSPTLCRKEVTAACTSTFPVLMQDWSRRLMRFHCCGLRTLCCRCQDVACYCALPADSSTCGFMQQYGLVKKGGLSEEGTGQQGQEIL